MGWLGKITAAGRALLTAADAAAQRTALGVSGAAPAVSLVIDRHDPPWLFVSGQLTQGVTGVQGIVALDLTVDNGNWSGGVSVLTGTQQFSYETSLNTWKVSLQTDADGNFAIRIGGPNVTGTNLLVQAQGELPTGECGGGIGGFHW